MNITKYEKYFFILPAVLSIAALISIGMWGLKPGIDLAGGSLLQISYTGTTVPSETQVRDAVSSLSIGAVRVQPTNNNGYILRQRDLTNDEKNSLEAALGKLGTIHEDQFTSVGPTLGAELVRKAWIAITLVVLCIILFIAFAFRGVSKPVASWKYGIVAIITLLHDVLVPLGLFAALGYFLGAEVDSLFIVGLLTILGISINDTIVVFDRIRENLRLNEERSKREAFDEVVGRSITQTIARSINTSLTVIIVLVALYFLGPVSTKDFALTLIVGMVAGTYSSIFLAAPLLVVWERLQKKN
ncbi:MAG TPA: protein translocase subunit SecF [Candidatus Paceibacterota bacterium]|nr:protein translocase subunit SecF [Candidatus Paceibacterota bacterium]